MKIIPIGKMDNGTFQMSLFNVFNVPGLSNGTTVTLDSLIEQGVMPPNMNPDEISEEFNKIQAFLAEPV